MPQYSACNETHYEWVITVATGLWADIYDDARVDQYQYNKLQAAPSPAPPNPVLSDPLHSNRKQTYMIIFSPNMATPCANVIRHPVSLSTKRGNYNLGWDSVTPIVMRHPVSTKQDTMMQDKQLIS